MRHLFRTAALAAAISFTVPAIATAAPSKAKAPAASSSSGAPGDGCRRAKNKGCQFVEFGATAFDKKTFGPAGTPITSDGPATFGMLLKLKQPQFYRLSFDTAKLALFR